MSKSEIYVPIEGEILHLTDGTPIRVQRVFKDHFQAARVDDKYFTQEQAQKFRDACWEFTGKRGLGESQIGVSTGLDFVIPNSRQALELKVQQLGGTITWTDPDILKAREIWAKHARPYGNAEAILNGDADYGQVMQAILEAIRTTKGI